MGWRFTLWRGPHQARVELHSAVVCRGISRVVCHWRRGLHALAWLCIIYGQSGWAAISASLPPCGVLWAAYSTASVHFMGFNFHHKHVKLMVREHKLQSKFIQDLKPPKFVPPCLSLTHFHWMKLWKIWNLKGKERPHVLSEQSLHLMLNKN